MSSAPKISVQLTESTGGAIPIAGDNYDLICNVLGAELLDSIITYQWRKNENSSLTGTNNSTLSFAPARISDAGTNYSCSATVISSYLTDNVVVMTSRSHTVTLQSKFTLCYYHYVNVTVTISSNFILRYTDEQ